MPRIKKQSIGKKTQEKQLVFDTFLLYKKGGKNSMSATASKNCDCADGGIFPGLGIEPFQLDGVSIPAIAQTMESFHVVRIKSGENTEATSQALYAVTQGGYLKRYFPSLETFLDIHSNLPVKKILTVWQKDVGTWLFFITPKKICVQKNGEGTITPICSENRGLGCVCKKRVFYTKNSCDVAYSDFVNQEKAGNSLEGGGILYGNEKDGVVQGLVAMEDSVVVLYEKGLKKMKICGSPTEFVIEGIEYNGEKIYYNTACVCSGAVFFLAKDGVYRYDGNRAQRVCEYLSVLPADDDGSCLSACHEGEYLLSYTSYDGVKTLVVIKGDGKNGYYSDYTTGLSGNGNRAIAQKGSTIVEYERGKKSADGAYYYFVNYDDFGWKGNKTLKKLTFYGEGRMMVTVQGKDFYRKKQFTFEQGVWEWVMMEKSTEFAFLIQIEATSKLTKMVADVVYY